MQSTSSTKKQKKSQSKKIRDRIYVIWDMSGRPGDSEEYYYKLTEWFVRQLDRKINELGG